MAYAQGSRRIIRYMAETTFAETPATPTLIPLRNNSDSLNLSKDTFESAELRGDRSIRDVRHGNEQVSGDISFDLAYGDFDAFLEAVMCNSWSTDTLIQGTTLNSFIIEKEFADITQFAVYRGCAVNTLSLTLSNNAVVTGTLGILGAGADPISGTSVQDSEGTITNTEVFDSFSGTLTEDGSDIGIVTNLEFTIDNGLSANFSILGSHTNPEEALFLSMDRFNVTGTLTAYFEDASLANKFINETSSSLEFEVEDNAGLVTPNKLKFTFPHIKYTGHDLGVGDAGPITIAMPFQALYDTATSTALKIEKTDATDA